MLRVFFQATVLWSLYTGMSFRVPSADAAQPLQVWLGGVGPGGQLPGPPDYLATFEPGASWGRAAAVTNVFKVSTNFLAHATDQTLSSLIEGLRQRHIALAMEGLMLQARPSCGRGVEGYTGPLVFDRIATRLRNLGGKVSYLAMDEPIYFGHTKTGLNKCNDSLESLAAQVAQKALTFRTAFPDIIVGDIEPVTDATVGDLDTIIAFSKAFRKATGMPLAFVDADVGWHSNYHPQLLAWRTALHRDRIRFGVICHGDPNVDSDQVWASQAIQRYRAVVSDPATQPDDVIFQSWMTRPTYMLPDSRFGTMTSIVAQAIESPQAR